MAFAPVHRQTPFRDAMKILKHLAFAQAYQFNMWKIVDLSFGQTKAIIRLED